MQQPLHVETEGCIINVFLIANSKGQPVTVVQIKADDYPGEGWVIEDDGGLPSKFKAVRVVKQTS